MPDWSKSPYVYVAHGRHGHKIGISGNPQWRMAGIRGKLIRKWHLPGKSRAVERTAHSILGVHRTVGEWFDVPKAVAIEAVTVAIQRVAEGTHVLSAEDAQARRDAEYAAAWRQAVEAANVAAEQIGWP